MVLYLVNLEKYMIYIIRYARKMLQKAILVTVKVLQIHYIKIIESFVIIITINIIMHQNH